MWQPTGRAVRTKTPILLTDAIVTRGQASKLSPRIYSRL